MKHGLLPLLFALFALPAFSQVKTFGDWKVDLSDPTVYSATSLNDSNHEFGQYCFLDKDGSLLVARQQIELWPDRCVKRVEKIWRPYLF